MIFLRLPLLMFPNAIERSPTRNVLVNQVARPARPTWMISPVRFSSALRTGQLAPSALTIVHSSFVPMILNVLFSVSTVPNSSTFCLYRFGGVSVVGRSSSSKLGEAYLTTALSLSIFLRKKDAITVLPVW